MDYQHVIAQAMSATQPHLGAGAVADQLLTDTVDRDRAISYPTSSFGNLRTLETIGHLKKGETVKPDTAK
ncbi:hypothetical protein [Nocardia sp. NPDC004711]